MKKMIFICLLIAGTVVLGFANDRSNFTKNTTKFGFVNACDSSTNIQLMKKNKSNGDHKVYKTLAPHENTWLYGAIGFTIGFAVAVIAGPTILGINQWLFLSGHINVYTYWGLSALGGTLVGLAFPLFAAMIVFWVFYGIVQHGKKKGYCMFKNVSTFECATPNGDGASFGFKIAL